jgi:hypothetical protein
MRTSLLVLLLLGLAALPAAGPQHVPDYVSMVQLIANPHRYDGRIVGLVGFLDLSWENPELYLGYEDYENMLGSNGIMISPSTQMAAHGRDLDRKYVLVVGKFTAKPGNLTQGVISDITRFQEWSDPNHPRRLVMKKLWPRNPSPLPKRPGRHP